MRATLIDLLTARPGTCSRCRGDWTVYAAVDAERLNYPNAQLTEERL